MLLMPDVFPQKDFQLAKEKEKGIVKTETDTYAGLSLKLLIFPEDIMKSSAGTTKKNQPGRITSSPLKQYATNSPGSVII